MPFEDAIEILRIRFQQTYAKDPVKDRNGDHALLSTVRSAYQTVARDPRPAPRESAKASAINTSTYIE
jgi:hypothetical protein